MTDLVDRLLGAIEETEHREHRRFVSGWLSGDPCTVCERPVDVVVNDSVGDHEQVVVRPCGHLLAGDDLSAFRKPQPAPDRAVLRRCAADRRIVETYHAMREASEVHADAFSVMKTVLRDLADGYGIEVPE